MRGMIATLADIIGTIVFILIFTPAFMLLTVSIAPLAMTLRVLRWLNNKEKPNA